MHDYDIYDIDDNAMERRFLEIQKEFALTLDDRLAVMREKVRQMKAMEKKPQEAVEVVYLDLHSFCGKAGMVGFDALGKGARVVLNILSPARKELRAMTGEEGQDFDHAFNRFSTDMARTAEQQVKRYAQGA